MWAQEGARHTSEMPSWRSKKWRKLHLLICIELKQHSVLQTLPLLGWVGAAWLAWVGTLHCSAGYNRPGIDERTPDNWWQGKAGQGRGQRRALGRIFIA